MPQSTVTKRFRNPQALSGTLTALGTLQPRALGILNRLVSLASTSNYYLLHKSNSIVFCKIDLQTEI